MVETLQGGVFVNTKPVEERIAGLEDLKKLPIGPTLPIAGKTQPKPEEKREKKPKVQP